MNINAKDFEKLLVSLGACSEASSWSKEKSLDQAWGECERADWMLWLLGKMADEPGWPTRNTVIELACDCAETALPIWEKYYPNCPQISNALEGARKFLRGEISREELSELRDAVNPSDDVYAAYAAASSVYAAAAANIDYIVNTVAHAAAAYAAYDDSRKEAHIKMCKIIRSKIKF